MELLQHLQDSFFATSEIAAGIFDESYKAVTRHAASCEFCSVTRSTPEGEKRCVACDMRGMDQALRQRRAAVYTCHAGLTDFATPIILEDQPLGYFAGGRVLTDPLEDANVRAYAKELGIDPEKYVKAAKDIPVIPANRVEGMANFMYHMGILLSRMAYKQYQTVQMNNEIEREAHMKSDFLANMSHEIRTPMNAVIGMAEMALREEIPPAAREYIKQIMASGNTLLAIINDILDFTKIESGKMDINMTDYKPIAIVRDVANVIMTRIGDKNLEFIVDVDPTLPKQLMGDSIRIRQIILNLVNNAVKFTKEGCVHLTVAYESKSEREILLKVSIQDTGIGIKKEDLGKLFQSFQQVDSKRNRNIEGTGLGLAISKQLVALMNGQIKVESEYGKGSLFSFEIPQFIIDDTPLVEAAAKKEPPKPVGIFCKNIYVIRNIRQMLKQLDIEHILLHKLEQLPLLEEHGVEFLFIESASYCGVTREFLTDHPQIKGILLTGFKEKTHLKISNLLPVRKPLHILNMARILANESLYETEEESEESFEFIAPEANVLIVDDNELNLTVAEGLLEPLQMKIDKALSGKQAVEMINLKHYDLIFMDHMMPELDGIETTHLIRRFHDEYDNVPIIALTANVVEEMRAMFLVEGMNDFVAKPIELRAIVEKVRQWLPDAKIKKVANDKRRDAKEPLDVKKLAKQIAIPGLDLELALGLAGSEKLFWDILKEYVKAIPRKSQLLEQRKEAQDWKNYTIDAHALKSSSKQIGAVALSDLAAAMEQAGKDHNIAFILAHHEELLEKYRAYEPVLIQFVEPHKKEEKPKLEYDSQKVRACLDELQEAADDLDMDAMDQALEKLGQMNFSKEEEQYFLKMKDAVEEVEVEICETLIEQWRQLLG